MDYSCKLSFFLVIKIPGATDDPGQYKVPEYYQYDKNSYYDLDKDMVKYRIEQPKPGEKC